MDDLAPRGTLRSADVLLAAALTGLLFCVYVLTASFTFVSDDELYIFDTTESIARHLSTTLSETGDRKWPGESEVEPAMPLLAAPLYWVANQFSGIGNVHGTLLFNPLITAFTGALIYFYARRLGYNRQVSLLGGLAFGLATIVWPYTKTFFREPLHMATLFATAFCMLSLRQALERRSATIILWLVVTITAASVSLFAKESALYALPLLLLIFVPSFNQFRQNRKLGLQIVLAVVITLVVVLIGLSVFDSYFGGDRFDILRRLDQMGRNFVLAQQGIIGFLFSPGKSLFLFSPPLLLALAAPFVGERSRRFDVSWPLILLVTSVLIYALVRGELWWGGTNWGPRYMVPLTPFLIIGALPVMALALQTRHVWAKVGLALVILAGVAVQIGAVSINLTDYYRVIGPLQPGAPWTIGLWDINYSAIVVHWQLIFTRTPDFAWAQALLSGPAWMVPILNVGAFVVFGIALTYGLKIELLKRRTMWAAVLGGLALTAVITWLSLHSIYYDRRYQGDNENLHQLNAALAEASVKSPDPVIFLNNHTYRKYMLNFYKGPAIWFTLPLNPNDLPPAEQPKPLPSIDPLSLVEPDAYSIVNYYGRQHQTIFLIMEFGPFTPDSPRPLEWWMSRTFFYKGVYDFGPTTRLLQFSSQAAPAPNAAPAHPTGYQLGDAIRLMGWDAFPDGSLRPGDVLNISTQWQTVIPPATDYKIGTYLIAPEGSVVAQDDSFPVNGFWPTITWQAGDYIRHNVALILPDNLQPGFYEVWTLMYSATDGSRLPVQDASSTTIRDHVVLLTAEVTR